MDKRKIETKESKQTSTNKSAASSKPKDKGDTKPGDPIHSAVDGSYAQAVPANQPQPGQTQKKDVKLAVNDDTAPRSAALKNDGTPAGFPVIKEVKKK